MQSSLNTTMDSSGNSSSSLTNEEDSMINLRCEHYLKSNLVIVTTNNNNSVKNINSTFSRRDSLLSLNELQVQQLEHQERRQQKYNVKTTKDGFSPQVVPAGTTGVSRTTDSRPYSGKPGETNTTLLLRQTFAASGPVIFTIGSGMTAGFSAVLLPQLRADDSNIPIDEEEASWIASMAALPMAVGCLAVGFIMERAGRRLTSLLIGIPAILGWILMATAQDLRMLLAGRFLTGFAAGAFGPVGLVYIGETSAPIYRGVLLAATAVSISLGILISHILGALLPWKTAAGLCIIAPVIGFVLIFFAPESPSWLSGRGRREEAQEIFRWLRGTGPEATSELQALQQQQQQSTAVPVSISKQLLRPSFFKPFFFMNIFFFIQQFSGVNAVAFYTVSIFKQTLSAGGSSVNEYVAMGILDISRVCMSVVACILLRRLGRRPLAIMSATGTALSLIGLSVFLFFGSSLSADNFLVAWAPVIFLVSYMCFVSVGLVPLPWVMTGEVFPGAVRGIGSGSTSCVGFLVFFAVVKSGPAMFSSLGSAGAFMTYGIVATLGGVYLFFFCPETKNKTLQDIENKFNEKSDQAKRTGKL